MEKVFAGTDRDREKFDVAQFRDDDNSRKTSKFSDRKYINFPIHFYIESV